MNVRQSQPYGSWDSLITAQRLATASIRLHELCLDGDTLYWLELRPDEGGRGTVMRRIADGSHQEVTPPPYNCRSGVHEYGGGAFTAAGGRVYLSHFGDHRLYACAPGDDPHPLTAPGDQRYADPAIDPGRRRLVCILEDHAGGGPPDNAVAAVELDTGAVRRLVTGSDFYSTARVSPDGAWLAWLSWDHPHMPWDAAALWVAALAPDGTPGHPRHIAGGHGESVCQPEWAPDGTLYFVSDRSGWWNLYRLRDGVVSTVVRVDGDMARAHWQFGMTAYALLDAGRAVAAVCQDGMWTLYWVDLATGHLTALQTGFNDIGHVRAGGGRAAFIAGGARVPEAVVLMEGDGRCHPVRRSTALDLDTGWISEPVPLTFPTTDDAEAHGFLYRPTHPTACAPEGERPPLLVTSHGGPTAACSPALNLKVQFWTTRGFAVLAVNYRGSTGYGRAYREALYGRWGVVDVDDCAAGALYLVDQGEVDGGRMAISGSSAGGYTVLCALTFRDIFAAGASHYGVSDLEALAAETHKFEARYLDRLVGPYPAARDLYRDRSPLYHADAIACPVIFFQGLEDRVVPPDQAEVMVNALRARRLPVAYVTFEGEQHGFRRAESIQRAAEAELAFYGRVLRFQPAGVVAPVAIENL